MTISLKTRQFGASDNSGRRRKLSWLQQTAPGTLRMANKLQVHW